MNNKRAVDLLRQARVQIAEGTEKYICWALERVSKDNTSVVLQGIIQGRCAPGISYEGWLGRYHSHLLVGPSMTWQERVARKQLSRLAWIDSLIKEFS